MLYNINRDDLSAAVPELVASLWYHPAILLYTEPFTEVSSEWVNTMRTLLLGHS